MSALDAFPTVPMSAPKPRSQLAAAAASPGRPLPFLTSTATPERSTFSATGPAPVLVVVAGPPAPSVAVVDDPGSVVAGVAVDDSGGTIRPLTASRMASS